MKISAATVVAAAVNVLLVVGTNAELLRRRTSQVCSTQQALEFDCDIMDDVVGVYVCRAGGTTCVNPSATLSTDTCGCCTGDNRPDCIDDGDFGGMGQGANGELSTVANVTTMGNTVTTGTTFTAPGTVNEVSRGTGGACAAFLLEFDCDIADDVVGVFVCRDGQTTCVLAADAMSSDTCGCCPGDSRAGCEEDGDAWTGGDDNAVDDDPLEIEGVNDDV
ncbi:expressed unknown protein [Seminavis robusta]|uniref:Uncharacterized protein n=1 Tax=Seminavis robusta TaxID=568900 RepID=A0A9N8ESM5_9STRA|nr:expressed unknown protein [Seminavis robusta]|eukprot:Sro1565_g282860.1 n/a (220) ;mRNA; r:15152-15811